MMKINEGTKLTKFKVYTFLRVLTVLKVIKKGVNFDVTKQA